MVINGMAWYYRSYCMLESRRFQGSGVFEPAPVAFCSPRRYQFIFLPPVSRREKVHRTFFTHLKGEGVGERTPGRDARIQSARNDKDKGHTGTRKPLYQTGKPDGFFGGGTCGNNGSPREYVIMIFLMLVSLLFDFSIYGLTSAQ